MEFLRPKFTDVLSTPIPTQFCQEIPCFINASSILEKMPSAVEVDDMHMSKNCVQICCRAVSKNLIVSGFIFSTPVSLEPSIATANGAVLMASTSLCWK
jgi:hypothetical protein